MSDPAGIPHIRHIPKDQHNTHNQYHRPTESQRGLSPDVLTRLSIRRGRRIARAIPGGYPARGALWQARGENDGCYLGQRMWANGPITSFGPITAPRSITVNGRITVSLPILTPYSMLV